MGRRKPTQCVLQAHTIGQLTGDLCTTIHWTRNSTATRGLLSTHVSTS